MLIRSASQGSPSRVKQHILKIGGSPGEAVKACKRDGTTSLHAACEAGHVDVCALLLEYGADPNSIDCYGSTPLAHACRKGHADVTQLLLDNQANPNRRSHQGFTPLLRACAESGAPHEACVALLLERHADVTASKTPDGTETALVLACRRGDAAMAALLVEAYAAQGADQGSSRGQVSKSAALVAACGGNHVECAEMLMARAGATPDAASTHEMTPLMAAACADALECVALLLRWRADIDQRGPSGGSALLYAAMRGHTRVVKLLCRHGARRSLPPSAAGGSGSVRRGGGSGGGASGSGGGASGGGGSGGGGDAAEIALPMRRSLRRATGMAGSQRGSIARAAGTRRCTLWSH